MRFDAYAGNVSGSPPEEVASMLAHHLSAHVDLGRPRGRYHRVLDVKSGHDLLGWVGHDFQLDTAYFEFKGETTPDAALALRKHWPEAHSVSRLDACEDYDEDGSFDRLVGIVDTSKDPRVKSKEIRPRGSDDGRTVYWGSPTSQVMVRVYEAGKMKERRHYQRPGWVRAEAQVRPAKSLLKRAAAQVSPLNAWGFAAWSQRAAELLSSVDVQRFAPVAVAPEFDRTTRYVARAFRRHFEEMLADFGDWTCIGRELEAVWHADDSAKGSPS